MPLIVGFFGNAFTSFAFWLIAGVLPALFLFCGVCLFQLSIFLMFIKTRDTAAGLHVVTRKDFHSLRDVMNTVNLKLELLDKKKKINTP